jgi:hypothetical protein
MHYTWEGGEMHTIFLLEDLKGKDQSEELDLDGRIILVWILGKYSGRVWTGFVGTSGGHL